MRVNDTALSSTNILLSDTNVDFSSAVVLARQQRQGDSHRQSLLPGDKEYENKLNALAVEMAGGIDIDKRKVFSLTGDAAEKFRTLVNAELNAQRANDEKPDLGEAIDQAKDALFERIGNALDNTDRSASKGLDVFEGYWKRHGGEEAAIDTGYDAFDDFLADKTLTSNPDYEDNLNALALGLSGSTLTGSRQILHLDGSDTLSQLYKNLVQSRIDQGEDPGEAVSAVNDDLRNRIDNVGGGNIVNVFDGYFKRHGGEEDAAALGKETWMAHRDEADIAHDNILNSLASDMADGIDTEKRTVHTLTGDAGDRFRKLVGYQLAQQREQGDAPDLKSAISEAKKDLFDRIGNALTNADKDGEDGLNVFNGYFERHGGEEDAINAGYSAYDNFLAENTVTDNSSYEDNLNALAEAMAGATLTDSRQILHLDSSETMSQLYQNLIAGRMDDGASLEKATREVNDALRERIKSASGDDGKAVQNVFDGYWSRHGGDNDAQRLAGNAEIDTARREHELPPLSNVDIRSLETSEADPDDGSRKQTVSELTWKTLIDDWKTGIKDKSIDKNDERAQFYRALRAQGALDNGLEMVGLDVSEGLSLDQLDGKDFSSIINGEKLDDKLGELFASDAVQDDYMSVQAEAVDKVPNKDAIASRLEETAFSDDYIEYINDLRKRGQGELAEQDIAGTYSSLAAMFPATEDSDRAAEFAQSLQLDSMITDLDDLIASPDNINDANLAASTQDVVRTILTALKRGGVDIPRRTAESIDKFVNEFMNNKQSAASFGKALQELGNKFEKNGSLTEADIKKTLSKDVYQALNEKTNGGMMSLISHLNGNGALGSAGGLISLTSAVYQLAGGRVADKAEAGVAITKELVSFLGASQHFVNLGSNIKDNISGSQLNQTLGLDKSLDGIWSTDKPTPGRQEMDRFQRLNENLKEVIDSASVGDKEKLGKILDLTPAEAEAVVKGVDKGFVSNPELPNATTTTRNISSFLRILDGAANSAAGALDIALGGLMIKRGADSGDGATIGQGAVTVAAGAFGLAGGGAALAALKGIAFARAATGPLFWVSAGLTLATLPFTILQDIKRTNALEGHQNDLNGLFNSLDQDGLLTEDGADRYEFLKEYVQSYGQRDAPDDKSIFEYRSDEYAFFLRESHLPEEGWDDFTHEDYAGDGDNLQTDMDKGSTVGA